MGKYVSSVHTTPILKAMATLGTTIRDKRTELGMLQGELALRARIPQAALSDIERGKTKLPNADIRRRLAMVLGVSHLDLLVAAGEITERELASADAVGVVELAPDDPRRDLKALIDRVAWTEERVDTVRRIIGGWYDWDAEQRKKAGK